MIREADPNDLNGLLELYLHLHEKSVPQTDERLMDTWKKILDNDDYHLIVAEEDNIIVSSCTCIIVPNLTRDAMPYAVIENVVTHKDYRNRGLAHACLERARETAENAGCYKMMLITGSDDPKTHEFYRNSGFSCEGKTAYYSLLKKVNWNRN